MSSIHDFMTPEEQAAYGLATGLAAAREPDRKAWSAGVGALRAAEERAINAYSGEVKLNRFGRPHGGVHPALACLSGYLDLSGCYQPE